MDVFEETNAFLAEGKMSLKEGSSGMEMMKVVIQQTLEITTFIDGPIPLEDWTKEIAEDVRYTHTYGKNYDLVVTDDEVKFIWAGMMTKGRTLSVTVSRNDGSGVICWNSGTGWPSSFLDIPQYYKYCDLPENVVDTSDAGAVWEAAGRSPTSITEMEEEDTNLDSENWVTFFRTEKGDLGFRFGGQTIPGGKKPVAAVRNDGVAILEEVVREKIAQAHRFICAFGYGSAVYLKIGELRFADGSGFGFEL